MTTPTGTVTFMYDALRNRVGRIQGGVTTKYALDLSGNLSKVIQVQNPSGPISYIYGVGLLASIDASGNIVYYHFNSHHNTVALSNSSGSVTDRYTYLSSGKVFRHAGTSQQPFTFMGEYGVQQESSTLYYVRARYYDASQNGIFLNKDPYPASLINPQTLNRYVYGLNNPVSMFDPSGLHNNQDNNGTNNSDVSPYPDVTNEFNQTIEYTKLFFINAEMEIDQEFSDPLEQEYAKLYFFYLMVKSGGPFDIKLTLYSPKSLGAEKAIYNGMVFSPDDFGNYDYGVAAAALGLPNWLTKAGAGFSQVFLQKTKADWKNFNGFFDQLGDTKMIEMGYYSN